MTTQDNIEDFAPLLERAFAGDWPLFTVKIIVNRLPAGAIAGSKKARAAIRRGCKWNDTPFYKKGLAEVHARINERAAFADRFAAVQIGGKVGYIVSGMDCDCTQYHREGIMDVPASLVAFVKDLDEHYQWLDGPESTYYVRPDEVEDGLSKSADRALEAFEDGHPGTVYWGDL